MFPRATVGCQIWSVLIEFLFIFVHIIKRTLHGGSKTWILFLVLKTLFYSLAALVRKVLFSPHESNIHIFSPPWNMLYICTPKSRLRHNWKTTFVFCSISRFPQKSENHNLKIARKVSANRLCSLYRSDHFSLWRKTAISRFRCKKLTISRKLKNTFLTE